MNELDGSDNLTAIPPRWQLHRAGIVNVYQYENEVLDFAGGRLLLRGVNGSGKSTAMNMLLPFLLTARVRGIDAAGEQTGVLKSWMLSGRDEPQPVGYLWLEFARAAGESTGESNGADPTEYLTIGCGIKANRSTDNVTTWWFVTTRRPGIDLELVERGVPLSADALRATIGPDPVIPHDRRGEYRREVGRRLYGGADIESFLDLLNAVRSPRVGDRVDVDLPEYLVAALPSLSEQALTEAARPLDDLDEHRRNVADLEDTAAGLAAIEEVYRNYVRTEVQREVATAREVLATAHDARRVERADARTMAAAAAAEAGSLAATESSEADVARLAAEIAALESSSAYTEGRQLDDLRAHVAQLRGHVADADQRVANLTDRAVNAAHDIRRQTLATDESYGRLVDELSALDADAATATLTTRAPAPPVVPRRPLADDLDGPDGDLDLGPVRVGVEALGGSAGLRTADLADVRGHIELVEREAAEVRAAEAATSIAAQNVDDAHAGFVGHRTELDAARNRWDEDVRRWVAERALPLTTGADTPTIGALGARLSRPDVDDAARTTGERPELRRAVMAELDTIVDRGRRDVVDAEHAQATADGLRLDAQSIVEELAARSEPEPPRLGWQQHRGRGLADLVEFADHVDDGQRAGLEAALEASGLLTAVVTDEGARLETGELIAHATGTVAVPLSDLLAVSVDDDTTGVGDVVSRVLGSVSTDPSGDAPSMVAVDGTFRLGALRGRHDKAVAEYVGVGARRARLERQRVEAAAVLRSAEDAAAEATDRLEVRRRDLAVMMSVLRDMPVLDDVDSAFAATVAAEDQLQRARERMEQARALAAAAEQRLSTASDELQRVARTLQLPTDRGGVEALGRTLDAIVSSARSIKWSVDAVQRAHTEWVAAVERWSAVAADVMNAQRSAASTRSEHDERAARLATLEDTLGVAFHEVVETIEVSRTDLDSARRDLPGLKEAHTASVRSHQAAIDAASRSTERRRLAEAACADAHTHFGVVLAVPGLVASSADRTTDAVTRPDSVIDDGYSDADADDVDAFRQLIDHAVRTVPEPIDQGTTADGVRNSLRQRRVALGAGWDAEDRQPDPALPMSVSVNGPLGQMTLAASVDAVGMQLVQLTSLLTQKQDQALRTLLQGMIAREVAEKMHRAAALVDLMNERLGSVTTAHGIGVRLRWRRSDDLDDDTRRTVAILAKLPDLRTEAEEAELRVSLAASLDEARRLEPDAPYRHLIGQVFDYRRWHDMAILLRRGGDTERRLNRRTPLSEGEKKLVTYLPLFAAVAAACDSIAASGSGGAPRFLLLDDAFAKVSEDNHAALFGLLVDLDLDFIATSERLWGTHATVPALSITEVVRDADLGVILLEHSTWNGRTLA